VNQVENAHGDFFFLFPQSRYKWKRYRSPRVI
jgi:hypothetical protein